MAPLVVDPVALDGAGSSLIDVGSDIGVTVSTLTGALAGCGSMCGNDPVGAALGHAYDRSADALVKAMAGARNGLVNLGDGVRMSAFNYALAEAQSDISGRGQPLPAPAATGRISAGSTPSAVGAGDSAPAGWGWVASYIGMIWPNGDSAKLRGAAGAWIAAGTGLLVTETGAAGPLGIIGAQQIPEGEMIGQAFAASLTAANQIMRQATTIAGQLTSYAGRIDAVHVAILDLLARICDPLTGFKEVWDILTDADEDEIKQIADDIKTVIDNFSAETSALASELAGALAAADNVLSAVSGYADKQWDQFLHGTDVGRVINQVGQYAKGAWGEAGDIIGDTAVSAWDNMPVRWLVDPVGMFEHASDQLEGMAPLVGLGGEGAPGVADVWTQVGKDLSHWDLWGTNPAEAAGRTVIDVASLVVPGGAEAKVTRATHTLEEVAEHLPAAAGNVGGALPGHMPEVRPVPETPAPRPAEPPPGSPVPADRTPPGAPPAPRPAEPSPAPRPAEPSSSPAGAPAPHGPTESRPPAGAPASAGETPPPAAHVPAAAGDAPPSRGVPESAPAAAAPSGGPPNLPEIAAPATAAAGAADDLPRLPHLDSPAAPSGELSHTPPTGGHDAPAAGGTADGGDPHSDNARVPATVGAHSAEGAEHGHGGGSGGGGGGGEDHGSGGGGAHGSDNDEHGNAGDQGEAHDSDSNPDGASLDITSEHARDLGTDPDIKGFRPAEAETGLRVEEERGITLNRQPADASGDWYDIETGESYDAVGNFDGKHFASQWPNLQSQIIRHLDKADYVPVDVSRFNPEQQQIVRDYVTNLNNPLAELRYRGTSAFLSRPGGQAVVPSREAVTFWRVGV